MINNCYSGFYKSISPDKRLDKRMEKIAADLLISGTSTVNRAVDDHASKIAFYRTLKNKRFTHDDILSASYRRCAENIDVDHVLCIQDTSEFTYARTATKIGKSDPDIGPTRLNMVPGLFCHPTLVCDTSGQIIYGLSSASLFNRTWGQKDKNERNYSKLPIEQKESFRWIENAQNTRALIAKEISLTIIADRESDIFEEFVRVPDENTFLLVRSSHNRKLEGSANSLNTELEQQPLAGTSKVTLVANPKRQKRTADIEIRYCPVVIKAPTKYKGTVKSAKVHVIEAKEVTENLPKDQDPILWRLITTHPIESLEKALQCIEWYKQRWLIEELFRVLKTKGFQLESSQLGNGAAIKKLIAFTLEAALQVMRLKLALDKKQETPAKMLFSKQQLLFLTFLLKKVEGNTAKQMNPYPINTTAWAAWIIARLGKWTGYKSHGPPGYITMKNGYNTFLSQYEIFELLNL